MVWVQPQERELFGYDAPCINKPLTTCAQASSETRAAPVCGAGRASETATAPASRESPDIGVFLQAGVVWVARGARQAVAGWSGFHTAPDRGRLCGPGVLLVWGVVPVGCLVALFFF